MEFEVQATGVADGITLAVPAPQTGHCSMAVSANLTQPPVSRQAPVLHGIICPRLQSIVAVVVVNFYCGDGGAYML